MKKQAYAQLTVRRVPKRVAERLKAAALRGGKSMNELTLELLQRGLGLEGEQEQNHDLDEFIGSWTEDPAFDEALASMRKVDPELWIASLSIQHNLPLYSLDAHFDNLPQVPRVG